MGRFIDGDADAWARTPEQQARLDQHKAWQRGEDAPNPFATIRRSKVRVRIGPMDTRLPSDDPDTARIRTVDYRDRPIHVAVAQSGIGYTAVARSPDGTLLAQVSGSATADEAFQSAAENGSGHLDHLDGRHP